MSREPVDHQPRRGPRILVTGATGMLGSALLAKWAGRYPLHATGGRPRPPGAREDVPYLPFDLRSDSYRPLIAWAEPEVIVHCAALTNVDGCEDRPDEALLVNGESVARLLRAAPAARLLYISSDAVFPDGSHRAGERTPPAPENAYGRSKLAGERHVLDAGERHVVLRTTIVGRNPDPARRSLADFIVTSLSAGRPTTLFEDALFTPISVWDLADELAWVIDHETPRLLHVAGHEVVSKLAFGRALARELGLADAPIRSGSIAAATFKARRSRDQSLDSSLYESLSRRRLPSLSDTVRSLRDHQR